LSSKIRPRKEPGIFTPSREPTKESAKKSAGGRGGMCKEGTGGGTDPLVKRTLTRKVAC